MKRKGKLSSIIPSDLWQTSCFASHIRLENLSVKDWILIFPPWEVREKAQTLLDTLRLPEDETKIDFSVFCVWKKGVFLKVEELNSHSLAVEGEGGVVSL